MKKRDFLLGLAATSTIPLLAGVAKGTDEAPPRATMVSINQDLKGYYAAPAGNEKFPAVIVLMEAFGLNDNIKGICHYLASQGYAALAPDFYRGEVFAYEDLKGAVAKLKTLKDEIAMADVGSALSFLGDRPEVEGGRLATVGFCMGGRLSFLANAVYADRLKAAVSFYGGGIAAYRDMIGRPALLDRVNEMKSPILLIYGAKDDFIKSEEPEKITKALLEANKNYTLSVFKDAGHGFAAYDRASYVEAAAKQAWSQTMNFLAAHM